LTAALEENGSTGFSWQISWTPEAELELVSDDYIPDQPMIPGSGGTRHFVLKPLQAGQVVVRVQYGRWWPGASARTRRL
jgi:predicted secreted protein